MVKGRPSVSTRIPITGLGGRVQRRCLQDRSSDQVQIAFLGHCEPSHQQQEKRAGANHNCNDEKHARQFAPGYPGFTVAPDVGPLPRTGRERVEDGHLAGLDARNARSIHGRRWGHSPDSVPLSSLVRPCPQPIIEVLWTKKTPPDRVSLPVYTVKCPPCASGPKHWWRVEHASQAAEKGLRASAL